MATIVGASAAASVRSSHSHVRPVIVIAHQIVDGYVEGRKSVGDHPVITHIAPVGEIAGEDDCVGGLGEPARGGDRLIECANGLRPPPGTAQVRVRQLQQDAGRRGHDADSVSELLTGP